MTTLQAWTDMPWPCSVPLHPGMLEDIINNLLSVLRFSRRSLCSGLIGCRDSLIAFFHSEYVQGLLTTLESSYIDATGRVYYATGAAVGTAQGLCYAARHVAFLSDIEKCYVMRGSSTIAPVG